MAASLRSAVAPFFAMEILKAATRREAEGARVFHMETGEPGSGAPQPVLDAAQAALAGGAIGYTEAHGVLALRARSAAHYGERYGFTPPVERIVVTTGGSAGLMLAFLAAFDVGDRVALANPGYPAYRNTLQALGLEPVPLPTAAETRFQPTVAMLEALDKPVQGLIVASPSTRPGPCCRGPRWRRWRRWRGSATDGGSGWSRTKSTTASPTASRRPASPRSPRARW